MGETTYHAMNQSAPKNQQDVTLASNLQCNINGTSAANCVVPTAPAVVQPTLPSAVSSLTADDCISGPVACPHPGSHADHRDIINLGEDVHQANDIAGCQAACDGEAGCVAF